MAKNQKLQCLHWCISWSTSSLILLPTLAVLCLISLIVEMDSGLQLAVVAGIAEDSSIEKHLSLGVALSLKLLPAMTAFW